MMYEVPDGLPTLSREAHLQNSGFACVMEYISVITGDRWTDHPKCTEPLIATVAITLNDMIYDDERRNAVLVPRIGRLVGTSLPVGAERLAYKNRLALMVRGFAPHVFDSMVGSATAGTMCGCSDCFGVEERRLHHLVARVSHRGLESNDFAKIVTDLTAMLDAMLDVADEVLGRTKRETGTVQELATFVAEVARV